MNHDTRSPVHRSSRLAVLLLLLVFGGACTSSNADTVADETAAPSTTQPSSAETTSAEGSTTEASTAEDEGAPSGAPAGEVVAVTATDYAFDGVPDEVAAGTELTLQGEPEAEPHEAVIFKLADGDERTAMEILQSGEEQQFAGVLIAPPGGAPGFAPQGPVVLEEPGRYLLVCFIPTGTTPEAFGELAASGGTSEDLPETGPPHFVQGMTADLTVTS